MIKTQKMRFILGVSLFFLALVGALEGMARFYPLAFLQVKTQIEFKMRGVKQVSWTPQLKGYVLDQCSASQPGGGCACVALLHGLGDHAMTWKEILLFPDQGWYRMGLRDRLKIFAFDLPGSGKTPIPTDSTEFQVRRQAQKIQEVLSQNCSQWIVVGNSLGGWIASWLALDWPKGVSRLILLAPAGIQAIRESETPQLLAHPSLETLKAFQKKAYAHPIALPEYVWKQVLTQMENSSIRDILNAQVPADDLDLRLHDIRAPVVILWGKEDQVIPLALGKQFREFLRGSIWREISDCGHLPQKECPAVVLQSIIDMIRFGAI